MFSTDWILLPTVEKCNYFLKFYSYFFTNIKFVLQQVKYYFICKGTSIRSSNFQDKIHFFRYAILGETQSGKSTLLSCIVGRDKIDKGHIWVLGGKPRTKNSGALSNLVGYMPQVIINFIFINISFYFFYIFILFSYRNFICMIHWQF